MFSSRRINVASVQINSIQQTFIFLIIVSLENNNRKKKKWQSHSQYREVNDAFVMNSENNAVKLMNQYLLK